MLLAQRAINGSYLIAGLHVKLGHSDKSADFRTRLESGPLTDLVASACVIAQLDLLQHAAPVFGWTVETSTLENLLDEAGASERGLSRRGRPMARSVAQTSNCRLPCCRPAGAGHRN